MGISEEKMIAQKIIKNARDQEGTSLLSWESSATAIIKGYGENKRLTSFQTIYKKVKAKLDSYDKRAIDSRDQFSLGRYNALKEIKELIEEEI